MNSSSNGLTYTGCNDITCLDNIKISYFGTLRCNDIFDSAMYVCQRWKCFSGCLAPGTCMSHCSDTMCLVRLNRRRHVVETGKQTLFDRYENLHSMTGRGSETKLAELCYRFSRDTINTSPGFVCITRWSKANNHAHMTIQFSGIRPLWKATALAEKDTTKPTTPVN